MFRKLRQDVINVTMSTTPLNSYRNMEKDVTVGTCIHYSVNSQLCNVYLSNSTLCSKMKIEADSRFVVLEAAYQNDKTTLSVHDVELCTRNTRTSYFHFTTWYSQWGSSPLFIIVIYHGVKVKGFLVLLNIE